ncbi:MAG: YwmB family TATA-box binding protein [Syntrophomonadaceae bacterium]|nr:YwmB family TATA-box binding protein [Syntrophomonadaceae bacterium]MDD3023047.1 YwmB family TATA-box binding protein [Syntrophomonadaceae bacterium]
MIKSGLYIITFIIFCSIANFITDYTIEKEIKNRSPFYLSFASIGAISLESRLDCWAKINTPSTSQELEEKMISLLTYLDLPIKRKFLQFKANQETKTLNYKATKNNHSVNLTIGTDSKNNSYYLLSFKYGNKSHIEEYQRIINKYDSDLNWNYYYQYSGEIGEQLDRLSQQKVLEVVMKNFNAKDSEVFRDTKRLGMTGFSPTISNVSPAITDSGKKYNIEAVTESNARDGKTRVYIGAPFIMKSYW